MILFLCTLFLISWIVDLYLQQGRRVWYQYPLRILIGLDQLLLNVVPGPFLNLVLDIKEDMAWFGYPDETHSSVVGKNKEHWPRYAKFLDYLLLDKNHAEESIEPDEGD